MEEKEKQEVVFETSFLNQTLLLERTSLRSDSQVTVNIVSKHICLSVSFRDSFLFSTRDDESCSQRASQAVNFPVIISKFSMLFCSQWLPVSPFPQRSRLTAIFHLENNANISPLWITGRLGSLMWVHIWPFMR